MPAVACPACGKQYDLPLSTAGQIARCACGKRFRLAAVDLSDINAPAPSIAPNPRLAPANSEPPMSATPPTAPLPSIPASAPPAPQFAPPEPPSLFEQEIDFGRPTKQPANRQSPVDVPTEAAPPLTPAQHRLAFWFRAIALATPVLLTAIAFLSAKAASRDGDTMQALSKAIVVFALTMPMGALLGAMPIRFDEDSRRHRKTGVRLIAGSIAAMAVIGVGGYFAITSMFGSMTKGGALTFGLAGAELGGLASCYLGMYMAVTGRHYKSNPSQAKPV